MIHGTSKTPIESNGGVPINIQDQYSPTLILPLVQQLGVTITTSDTALDDYIIAVTSSVGMSVGNHFRIINSLADRYYYGTILSIDANNITVDTPVDHIYLSGSEVTWGNTNLAVNGSVTPVHFHLRTGTPSIPSAIDITRMIMVCETDGVGDLGHFGDLTKLTKGLVFRTENGNRYNIFNVKTNGELANLAYDLNTYAASNPQQGINGFAWRLTFGGQSKIGVVIRVLSDGQLGLIVQDDLTGLVSLKCIVEGHVVIN